VIGASLSRYKVLEQLVSGGMGDVDLADDTELGRQVYEMSTGPRPFGGDTPAWSPDGDSLNFTWEKLLGDNCVLDVVWPG